MLYNANYKKIYYKFNNIFFSKRSLIYIIRTILINVNSMNNYKSI